MKKKNTTFQVKTYIDKDTGQEVHATQTEFQLEGRKNFYICYIYNLMKVFDVFGGKKYKVLEYIIDNMNSDNQLISTTRKIANATNISTKTITETLKVLEDNDIIIRQTGCIMLNPLLFNNKSVAKEEYMIIKYNQIKRDQLKNDRNSSNNQDNDLY